MAKMARHRMLKFIAPADADKKYAVKIQSNSVQDFTTGTANTGPSADHVYHIRTGSDIAMGAGADTDGPTIAANGYSPLNSNLNVATNSDIVLWFNEDVQKAATGTVSFCTNSDATAGDRISTATAPTVACTSGVNSLDLPATIDVSTVTLDRRKVTLNPVYDFKIGQKLHMVMPAGFIQDVITSGDNAMAKVEAAAYSFTIKDEDTVKPHVDYVTAPSLLVANGGGAVTIFFSEAIQAGSGSNPISNSSSPTTVISGNKATIASTWQNSQWYSVADLSNCFKDLSGNGAWENNTYNGMATLPSFVITEDATKPTATATPASDIDPFDVITLRFDEVVTVGTGKISVYSRGSSIATGTLLQEIDASSLDLVTNVDDTANKMISSVSISASTKFMCGTTYRVHVPSTVFADASGNKFDQYDSSTGFVVTGREKKDTLAPTLKAVNMGAAATWSQDIVYGTQPSSLVMYFSEKVQHDSSKKVLLLRSTGGNHCAPGAPSSYAEVYNYACGWSDTLGTDPSGVELTSVTVSGAKVTATVPTLVVDKGYKLFVPAGAFKDLALTAQTNAEIDGETSAYILRAPTAATADATGPTISDAYPPLTEIAGNMETERTMIPPSTSVAITFNENVQAGTGNINVGSVAVPVSSCFFSAATMSCKPASDLARNTQYSVTYAATAVKDLSNNNAAVIDGSTTKLKFSTIDEDREPPVLSAVSAGTHFSEPMYPLSSATNVAKSTVVAMTFNENIQKGVGNVEIAALYINVDNVVIDGKTAFVNLDGTTNELLSQDALYKIKTSVAGVFKDTSTTSNDFKKLSTGYEFRTIADDAVKPVIHQQVPENDKFAAVKTDITLYFSEAVQASSDTSKVVTVSDGTTTNTIPVDNSNLEQGSVSILGSSVTIDPFNDMGYDKTVTVQVSDNAFFDFFGKGSDTVASGTYKFKTSSFNFGSLLGANNGSSSWSDREGPIVHYSNSTLMLYGGLTSSGCSKDLWTSTTGASWKLVAGKSNAPSVAYMPTAADGTGCLYTLGGSAGEYCAAPSPKIMKTCNNGMDWMTVATPTVRQFGAVLAKSEFPTSWSHIAMTIVGGWQLLVVDANTAVSKGVWRFMDKHLSFVQQIRDSFPFSDRKDPKMLSTSDEKVFLFGGHMCSDATCSNNMVFTDVWKSSNCGETWVCQTANFNAAMTSEYSKGIGRFASAVMTHDDTIFLLGGHKPNTTLGLNKIYTSSSLSTPPLDNAFAARDLKTQTPATVYKAGGSFSLYFKEGIQTSGVSGAPIRIMYYGDDGVSGGTTANADSAIAMSSAISHQVLTITTGSMLTAGKTYGVQVPKLSIKDGAGNYLPGHESFDFSVNADVAAPTVSTVVPTGAAISPFTTLTFTMSESVMKNTGSLTLVPVTGNPGHSVALAIADATIIGNKVFFRMPAGQNLTEGAAYNYVIPAGLLMDAAGNQIAAATATFGTVLSGSYTIHNYNGTDVVTVADIGSGNVNDTTKPTFVSMHPPVGATDVPAEADIAVLMYFSEPVKFNGSGIISFKNGSGTVVGTLNLTSGSGDESKFAKVVNGTKLSIPTSKFGAAGSLLLKKSGVFTVSIPTGVIRDANNNGLNAIAKTFTCLSGNVDTTSAVLTMSSPATASSGILGSSTAIDMYFSEDIEAGSGILTITSPSGSSGQVTTPITHSNVTISGAKLSLTVYSGALNTAGSYSIQIPPGTLKEASRHSTDARGHFTGINGTSMKFDTVVADVAAPTLTITDQLPPHEATTTYGLPISSSMLLDFNEVVQAGAGNIELVPKYTSPAITIAASSATFSSDKVFIDPPNGLMPGEVYTVRVGATAIKDTQANHYAGLTTGYTISTRAFVSFDESPSAGTPAQRYGAGVLVDETNAVWQFGGHNGSAGSDSNVAYTRFNDVLKLVTNRESNCASGGAPGNCSSASTCTLGSDGSSHKLGVKSVTRTVWRAPSAGGKKCYSPTNQAKSSLGETVSTLSHDCPCPYCLVPPPANATEHMVNSTYVGKYSLVSAAPGVNTRTLRCRNGKNANGSFTCVPDTHFKGKFQTPFPRCISDACSIAPSTANHPNFAAWDAASSTRSMLCSGVNTSNTMSDGESCGFKCAAGYSSNQAKFVCKEGNLTLNSAAACVKKTCSVPDIVGSSVGVQCSGGSSVELGVECSLTCGTGYTLTANAGLKAVCAVSTSAAAEADPSFSIPSTASCVQGTTTNTPLVFTTLGRAVVATTNPATSSTVSGSVTIAGDWGTPPPPAKQLEPPVGKAMADGIKLAPSQLTVACAFVDSVASSGRRLETSRSLTAAQDLQATYTITIPAGYISTAGQPLSASGVSSAVTALGSNAQFTADLKTNAAAAGFVINVTGVTVTEPTLGGAAAGGAAAGSGTPAPAASAEESSSNTGAIIGGILGAIFGISLIGVCVFCIIKKRKNEQE